MPIRGFRIRNVAKVFMQVCPLLRPSFKGRPNHTAASLTNSTRKTSSRSICTGIAPTFHLFELQSLPARVWVVASRLLSSRQRATCRNENAHRLRGQDIFSFSQEKDSQACISVFNLFSATMSELTVYTDGACRGNPGPGGFAAIMFFGDRTVEVGGGELDTTNNRMELSGVLIALSLLKKPTRVVIYSDSQYVCKGVSQWMEKWKRNGWTLGSGTRKSKHQQRSPVKNVDLWQQIYDLVHKHNVTMRWVRGHNGDENNEWADEMSVAMIGRDGGLDNLWMRDTPKSRASAKLLSEILYL